MSLLTEEKAQKLSLLIASFHNGGLTRRQIRRKLFEIRKGSYQLDDGLKECIEVQFKPNMQQNWETFTFTWDVAVNDPFKVITKEEWVKTGGRYNDIGHCDPSAFTQQG